jgi:hypothetical protein
MTLIYNYFCLFYNYFCLFPMQFLCLNIKLSFHLERFKQKKSPGIPEPSNHTHFPQNFICRRDHAGRSRDRRGRDDDTYADDNPPQRSIRKLWIQKRL